MNLEMHNDDISSTSGLSAESYSGICASIILSATVWKCQGGGSVMYRLHYLILFIFTSMLGVSISNFVEPGGSTGKQQKN